MEEVNIIYKNLSKNYLTFKTKIDENNHLVGSSVIRVWD
jgi:hypothetical protein